MSQRTFNNVARSRATPPNLIGVRYKKSSKSIPTARTRIFRVAGMMVSLDLELRRQIREQIDALEEQQRKAGIAHLAAAVAFGGPASLSRLPADEQLRTPRIPVAVADFLEAVEDADALDR